MHSATFWAIIFGQYFLGNIFWAIFFTNSSGHPAGKAGNDFTRAKLSLTVKIMACIPGRVYRLGIFSPLGRLFTLAVL
jgi:hypothetical protein